MSDNAKKVYTKGGDKGTTSLVGGKRVMKTDLRIEAYGTLDELNSVVGIVRLHVTELATTHGPSHPEQIAHLDDDLDQIQRHLFIMGSRLACEDAATLTQLPNMSPQASAHLEQRMDQMSVQLKPLQHFILPGGNATASYLHLARTVCRRAERRTLELAQNAVIESHLTQYLNRLSDYFFVASRFANHLAKVSEREWRD